MKSILEKYRGKRKNKLRNEDYIPRSQREMVSRIRNSFVCYITNHLKSQSSQIMSCGFFLLCFVFSVLWAGWAVILRGLPEFLTKRHSAVGFLCAETHQGGWYSWDIVSACSFTFNESRPDFTQWSRQHDHYIFEQKGVQIYKYLLFSCLCHIFWYSTSKKTKAN